MTGLSALTSRTRLRHGHRTKPPTLVRLDQVSLRDPLGKAVLHDFSFRIRAGERWQVAADDKRSALALLQCVADVQQPHSGTATIRGHVSWPMGKLSGLSPLLSSADNFRFFAGVYGQRGHIKAEQELLRSLCNFDEKIWIRPFKKLPQTLKQRFKLALGLVFDFDLYVFDPGAYAPLLRQGCWDDHWQAILEQRIRERAVITIAGDRLGIAERCQRCLVIRDGRLVDKGRVAQGRTSMPAAPRLRPRSRRRPTL